MRLCPNRDQLAELRPQLTDGEQTLVDFLDEHLPPSWTIYVQPYMNDMRPDVVVLNPNIGIVVFEVKDWSMGRYRFESGKMIAETATHRWTEDNPLLKARWYAKSIFKQFLATDEAELQVGRSPNDQALCRHAVYFHKAAQYEIDGLFKGIRGDHDILLGSDSLRVDNLTAVVPYCFLSKSKFIRTRQIEALQKAHDWLVPPQHALEQQSPLPQLTPEQREYGIPGSGFRRIRGVAGSGKSFVLAHRAARANSEGRSILVLSFNITMSHVLRDLLKRAPYPLNWRRITWGHFHSWAKKESIESGLLPIEPKSLRRDNLGHEASAEDPVGYMFLEQQGVKQTSREENIDQLLACLRQIDAGDEVAPGYDRPEFDGIYIDEAQDFDPEWLDTVARFLAPKGELVIFADHRQNLYGKDGGRDRAASMTHCKFRGPWAQMPRKSLRLPWRIAMFLNEFAQSAGVGDAEDLGIEDFVDRPEQPDLELDVLAWRPVEGSQEGLRHIKQALEKLGKPNPGDVVVLLPTHESGMRAVEQLKGEYHQIVHVFGANEAESRLRKTAFWMGRGGLKMSTIHSFKGWELDNVIVLWPPKYELEHIPSSQQASLFYTAVSRGMRNLVVLNANRAYDQYFKNWDLLEVEEIPS